MFKNSLNQRTLPGLTVIARYSLPIYGFHALFIHYLRTHHYDDMSRPWLDLPWVFGLTLGGSLLLGMALKRVDTVTLSADWLHAGGRAVAGAPMKTPPPAPLFRQIHPAADAGVPRQPATAHGIHAR